MFRNEKIYTPSTIKKEKNGIEEIYDNLKLQFTILHRISFNEVFVIV
jgi:hypothetical protein